MPFKSEFIDPILSHSTIIWDWNGTIIDDGLLAFEAEKKQFINHGLTPPTDEQRETLFGHPIEDYYRKVNFPVDDIGFDKISEDYMKIYSELSKDSPVFHGMTELFEKINALNKQSFILSAAPQSHVRKRVKELNLCHYFQDVYGLNDAQAKSKVFRAKELLKDKQLDPKDCIFVGDTDHDFEVADHVGSQSIIVAQGHQKYHRLSKLPTTVLKTRYK